MKPTNVHPSRPGRYIVWPAFVAALLILAAAGCTSDEPNVVGTGLVTDRIDTVLVPLGVEEVTRYSALKVENPEIPVHEQQLVYLGEQGDTRSSILANFDFSFDSETVPRDTVAFPDSLFTVENIKTVKFSLLKPRFYQAYLRDVDDDTPDRDKPTGQPVDLYYLLKQLETPFDPEDYSGWGENVVPPVLAPLLNSDFQEPNESDEPFLRMYPADFVRWFDEGAPIGIVVQLDTPSDPGLVGFGSRDTRKFSEFSDLAKGTVVAPNFVVEFENDYVDTNQFYLMEPFADTSTFDQVGAAQPDVDGGFMLRTGLRSYPALQFDLSGLPPNAFINRALLSVTNDTLAALGNLGAISVLEWDVERFGDPYATILLDDLDDRHDYHSFHITGQTSLDPRLHATIQFDVTQAVLRVVNQVYTGTRGLILTGGEDFLPEGFSAGVNPDFYYREFRFLGTAAADPAQRPQLKITYSLVDDLEKGGQ
ncbi:MAG: hypothetical protein ABFS42_11485 [Candidatus Krumholzibacteriota bacterium]